MNALFSGMIGVLSPWFLTLIPFAGAFLVFVYRKKGQHTRIQVGSLFLLKQFQRSTPSRKKFHPPLRFFFELLFLLLLALALGGLFLRGEGMKVAIVIDNSLSTGARPTGLAGTVLEEEVARVRSYLESLGGGSDVEIFLSTPTLKSLTAGLVSPGTAISSLDGIKSEYGRDNLEGILGRLQRDASYTEISVYTDKIVQSQGVGDSIRIQSSTVELPGNRGNIAVMSPVFRQASGEREAEIKASIRSFSAETSVVRAQLSSHDEGGTISKIAERQVTLRPGEVEEVSFSLSGHDAAYDISIVSRTPGGEAAVDALTEDNTVFLTRTSSGSVLPFVGDVPPDKLGFASLQGLTFRHVAPEVMNDTPFTAPTIFHRVAPNNLPATSSVLILPPRNNFLIELSAESSSVTVTRWEAAHPLLSYLNVPALSLRQVTTFQCPPWSTEVLVTTHGAVICAGETKGRRYVFVGFELLPFQGRESPVTSVLTLNILRWINDGGVGESTRTTWVPIKRGEDLSELHYIDGYPIELSGEGETNFIPSKPGILVAKVDGRSPRLEAVNFYSEDESDTLSRGEIRLAGAPRSDERAESNRGLRGFITALVLLLLLGDLLLILFRQLRRAAS